LEIFESGGRVAFESRVICELRCAEAERSVDGYKPIFECREIRACCAVFEEEPPPWATSGVCAIHAVMKNAEKRMREALAGDCLADLAARVVAKAPRGYGPQVVKWLDDRTTNRRAARSEQA
jgi:DNA-binding IscR family transcriptional regulator